MTVHRPACLTGGTGTESNYVSVKKKKKRRYRPLQKGKDQEKGGKREPVMRHRKFVMEKNRFYSLPDLESVLYFV